MSKGKAINARSTNMCQEIEEYIPESSQLSALVTEIREGKKGEHFALERPILLDFAILRLHVWKKSKNQILVVLDMANTDDMEFAAEAMHIWADYKQVDFSDDDVPYQDILDAAKASCATKGNTGSRSMGQALSQYCALMNMREAQFYMEKTGVTLTMLMGLYNYLKRTGRAPVPAMNASMRELSLQSVCVEQDILNAFYEMLGEIQLTHDTALRYMIQHWGQAADLSPAFSS